MKKVFRPHIILFLGGRFFTLFVSSIILLALVACTHFAFFENDIDIVFLVFLLIMVGFAILIAWLFDYLWPLIWGKLIITEDEIIWKCVFCKSVRIKFSDIYYIGIRNFGDRNYIQADIYRTGFQYLIISSNGVPMQPIDKVRCKKGVIKWMCSPNVCKILYSKVPEKYRAILVRKTK